jgi:hypothetical protein
MGEIILLNKYKMISSHVVNLKIGAAGNFLSTLYIDGPEELFGFA